MMFLMRLYGNTIKKFQKSDFTGGNGMSIQKKKPTKDGRQYVFRLRYKDIYGKEIDYTSPKFKTKHDAELAEAKYRVKLEQGIMTPTSKTFKEIFLEYSEYKKSELKVQTIKKMYDQFKHFKSIENVKINDFDIERYNKFRLMIEKEHYSINYSNKLIGLLKRLIMYSAKYYNTSDTILKFIERFKGESKEKREMDFFTYDEFKKFISVIDESDYKLFFETLYFLGLRQGECTALTWNDIDFNKKEVYINKTLTTKMKGELYTVSTPKTKNSYRRLPIPNKLLGEFRDRKEEAMQKKYFKESWFVFGDELPFRETTIQVRKNKYCDMAGLRYIRIHDFRHSCASFLINNGASIVLVSKYLGHSNTSITLDIYTHLYKNELLEVSKTIDAL